MTGSGPWELTVSVFENGKEGWPRKLLTNEPRVSSLLKGSGGDTTGETSIASGSRHLFKYSSHLPVGLGLGSLFRYHLGLTQVATLMIKLVFRDGIASCLTFLHSGQQSSQSFVLSGSHCKPTGGSQKF